MTNRQYNLAKLKHYSGFLMDRSELAQGKHQLLAEINSKQEIRDRSRLSMGERLQLVSLRVSRKLIPRYQLVVTFLLTILITTSTSFMAQAAVPGDFLWPVKLSFEKAELAFAVDSAQEGRLHLKHADNRLHELNVIIGQPDTKTKSNNISQLVRRLEKDITAADQSLKITREEKKDTHPQVIIALAKDVSDTANEAVKALEQNKRVLEAGVEPTLIETITGITPTSTESITEATKHEAQGLATSSEPGKLSAVSEAVQTKRDLKQVIIEVQIVNEYVSYNALEAMIEMVERRGSSNRVEVTALVSNRVFEQRNRLTAIKEAVPLINENFLLHRAQAQLLIKRSDETLAQAETALKLDNLSSALKRLNDAKDLIRQAASLLGEVENGHGFKQGEADILAKPVAAKKVKMQTITGSTTEPIIVESEAGAVH